MGTTSSHVRCYGVLVVTGENPGFSDEEWAKVQALSRKAEANRCPNCGVDQSECVCSDPDYRPRRNGEGENDYRRRSHRIANLRADEERGVLRREDRRLVQSLDAINGNLERLIDAVHDMERATGVPARVFDLLEDIVEHLTGHRPRPRY